MVKMLIGKKMIMINKYKMMSGPKSPKKNANTNLTPEVNQIHKKRYLKEVEVGIQVIVISIKVSGKCPLEITEIREDRALKSVAVDSKEAAEEVVLIMTDLIALMIAMIGISLGEEEAETTTKTEEISEIVVTSEEEVTVESIEEEEKTVSKEEEVTKTEETSTMIVENFKIGEIIMIKEIIKINATIMKSVITQIKETITKEENTRKEENNQIEGSSKIEMIEKIEEIEEVEEIEEIEEVEEIEEEEEAEKIEEVEMIEMDSKIRENSNLTGETSKKEIRGIMTISVPMMIISHPINKSKMEREDFPSEILKTTHHKETTNTNSKEEVATMMVRERKASDNKMITEDGRQ